MQWLQKVFGDTQATTPVIIPTDPNGYVLPPMSDFGKRQKYYPPAILRPNGIEMPTRGKYATGYPKGLCVHFTDGYSSHGKEDAINTLQGGVNEGYAYLVIDRNGVVYQTYPIDQWGYHCGESSWPGLGTSLNNKIIGVESCNMGQVAKRSDGSWGSKEQPGMKEYWSDDYVRKVQSMANMNGGTYLKFSPAQEKSLVELILWMAVNSGYGQTFIDNVVGHDEVAPERRDDPGGSLSMTMPEFRVFLRSLYEKI